MTHPTPPVCQVRVASARAGVVTAYIRRKRMEVGVPLSFDERYDEISALEAFASAFAADIVNGLRLRARKRRVELGHTEGVVKIWLDNPLSFLDVVGEPGNAAIRLLRLQIFVGTLEPEPVVRALLDETLAHSPLHLTLSRATEVEVEFQIAI